MTIRFLPKRVEMLGLMMLPYTYLPVAYLTIVTDDIDIQTDVK